MGIITDIAGARAALLDAVGKLGAIVGGGATGVGSLVSTAAGLIRTLARLQAEVNPVAHSTSSVEIGIGNKSFTVGTDTYLPENGEYRAWSDANPVNYLAGPFVSLVGGVLTIGATTIGPGATGTHADWTIKPIGERGAGGNTGASGASRSITVRCATTDNRTLASLTNGSFVDGVQVFAPDRVLRGVQDTSSENGPVTIQASGPAQRDQDFDSFPKLNHVQIIVEEGTIYGDTTWQCQATRAGTIGTNDIPFAIKPTAAATVSLNGRPIIFDNGRAIFPPVNYRLTEKGPSVPATPASGEFGWEFDVVDGTGYRFSFSTAEHALGNTPVQVATGSNLPLSETWRRPELVGYYNGAWRSRAGHAVIGGNAGGFAPNQFETGNDPDNANFTTGATVVDIVDELMNGMGIVRGVTNTETYATIHIPVDYTRGHDWIGARIWCHADNDAATWDLNQIGAWGFQYGSRLDSEGGDLFFSAALLERKWSLRDRTYLVFAKVDPININRFAIGLRKKVGETYSYAIANIQFHHSRCGPVPWIARGDYNKADGFPRLNTPQPILGGDLFFAGDRPSTIHLPNIVPRRDKRDFHASFSLKQTARGSIAYERSGDRRLDFDVGKLPLGTSDAELRVWPWNDRPQPKKWLHPLKIHKVAGSGLAKTTDAMIYGSSGTNRLTVDEMDARVAPMGVDVNWIGSMKTSAVDGSASNEDGPYAEARESTGLGSLFNCDTNCFTPTPLTVAGEAAYAAGDKTYRKNRNPWLREKAIDGSEDAIAKNGWVFDFGNGIARLAGMPNTNITMPKLVGNLLLSNDMTDDTSVRCLSNMEFCIPRFMDSILETDDSIKIFWGVPSWSEGGLVEPTDTKWIPDLQQRIAVVMPRYVELINDYRSDHPGARIYIVSAWAHMTPYADYATTGTINASRGNAFLPVTDGRHPENSPLFQLSESLAMAVANLA